MIHAGQLDRRITIEQKSADLDDGLRVKEGAWGKLVDRWASFEPLSGAEKIAAGETAAFRMVKFRIRRPSAFTLNTGDHRLRYRGTVCDIVEVREIDRDCIEIVAASRADNAPETA